MAHRGLWQHPFVDVFKLCDVHAWEKSQKEGDVSSIMAKDIGRRVLRIRGSVAASNFVRAPPRSTSTTLVRDESCLSTRIDNRHPKFTNRWRARQRCL